MKIDTGRPQTYEVRPDRIRAIQFTSENIHSIVDFLNRYYDSHLFKDILAVQNEGLRHLGYVICLRSKGFERDVAPFDWIVEELYSDGRRRLSGEPFPVWGNEEFVRQFRHASEYMPE